MPDGGVSTSNLDPRLAEELKVSLDRGLASGALIAPDRIEQHLGSFRDRFGPGVLRGLDGDALLRTMHGRQDTEARCLAYWLEFKNDEEFAGHRFGGLGGGATFKFGLYQRQVDGAWVTGSPNEPVVLSVGDAVAKARQQRDELLAGDAALAAMDAADTSDAAYARLQAAMEAAAPDLHGVGWAHKYWFLVHADKLDDYHSPKYQRFHLFKLLQTPPDGGGILDGRAPRFVCAGRFAAAAKELGVPITTLNTALNRRDGAFHRYWRVGTTGDAGESYWGAMREGGFVSIGWPEQLRDLSEAIAADEASARSWICERLLKMYPGDLRTASRKASEVVKFARTMAENDLVLASKGQTVLGVGRVRGPYEYDGALAFPHKRPVEWLLLEPWRTPEQEGLRTTTWEMKIAANLLELERRLFRRDATAMMSAERPDRPAAPASSALPPLDPVAARVDGILRRKGQAVLYGPPGTGKTHHALRTARELAARHAFRKTFEDLTREERAEVESPSGLVRLCTFHSGYGYEDFVEGLRPRTAGGQMVFEPRDGLFKRTCADATRRRDRRFFVVVDEFNRGDVPRVFGELLTVIELDKRGVPVVLPATGEPFVVPVNVFLIGTMNTADRSISLLDAALRRRFGFVELMPDSSQLGGRRAGALPLGPWLDALNTRLRRHLRRDARNLQVGHAYLMPRQPMASFTDFARVLRDDIIPLLEEYCYDDFAALRDILGTELVDADAGRIEEDMFAPNREEELLQAVSFVEMQQITLGKGVAYGGPDDETPGSSEAEDASDLA